MAAAAGRARPGDLCEAGGVDPKALADPAARLPISRLVSLYEAAARLTGDDSFGLHVGSGVDLHSFGACGYIGLNSRTVGEGLARVARYLALWTDGARLRLEHEGTTARLTWEYLDGRIAECRQDCEMSLLTVAGLGLVGDRDWRPREVHLRHAPPREAGEHRRLFRAPVHFRMPTNALILGREALDAPIPGADPGLAELLAGYAEHELSAAPEPFSRRARAALVGALTDGRPSVAALARRMGLGCRTLQRRLLEERASFRDLLGSVRRELAEEYLRDPRIPIAEIADRLGFAETSELQRAFRAWTGLPPGRYRRAAVGTWARSWAGRRTPER